jgi:hypothetical protein
MYHKLNYSSSHFPRIIKTNMTKRVKMDNGQVEPSASNHRLRRIARISSVVLIAFTIVMAIGHLFGTEPVEVDYDPIENILPVMMSLSVFALGLAWRREGVGAALSLVLFVLVIILDWIIRGSFIPLQGFLVLLPVPVTALLFLYYWFQSRNP